MAEVTLDIGGRTHQVACRDGEEDRLAMLGRMLADRWDNASRAAGALSGERTMLFVALMLADDLDEAGRRQAPPVADLSLDGLADRLERVASALERRERDA